ncbi:MAG: hypothetical protein ACK56W_11695 [Pirellula sp.]
MSVAFRPVLFEGNFSLSKFDDARRNSAAANPNRPPERSWEPSLQTVEGIVSGVEGTTLSMKNRNGHLVAHKLAEDATYVCDGKGCNASDLAVGQRVRVTVAKGDRTLAVGIESLDKDPSFKSTD